MNVSCPDCRSIFRVDPAKVPPSGVRARCSVCSGVISIPAPTGQTTPSGGTIRVPATPTANESGSPGRPRPTSQTPGGWDAPFGSAPQRTPPAPQVQRPTSAPPPVRTETPAAPHPRPESIERASVTATATPPSPSSGLPEFTPPPPLPPSPPFTPAASQPTAFTPPASPAISGPSAPFVPSGAPIRPAAPPPAPPPA